MIRYLSFFAILLLFPSFLTATPKHNVLEQKLAGYISDKDARIGIAVIINGEDTVAVNGDRDFPMMSVYKFPQAIAVADYCSMNGISVNDTITIEASEIRDNTWSPMREKYGVTDLRLPLIELLDYSLRQSDNNACDILFRLIGGVSVADNIIKSRGYGNMTMGSTEAEMHDDIYLCYLNRSTPVEMSRLFDDLYRQEMRHDSHIHETIASMMMSCSTGGDRLPAPLNGAGAIIGHKTGTGDMNSQNRIIAVNDAGYIFLPDGQSYAITVFIADSAYDMSVTSKMIADISEIVYSHLTR